KRDELEVYGRSLGPLQRTLADGFQSFCYVPLVTMRGMIGGLFLGRKDKVPFIGQDLIFLRRLASEMGFAVESAIAHEALLLEKERLQVLREINDVLISTLDLPEMLPAVSRCLQKAIPHENMSIYFYDEGARALRDHTPSSEITRKVVH